MNARPPRSATGWGKAGVQPLLRKVKGKPHATDEHHEKDSSTRSRPMPKKKSKSPTPVDADPKSSSDGERIPAGADGDDDGYTSDLPSSFPKDRAKLFDPSKSQKVRPQRRARGLSALDGAADEEPKSKRAKKDGKGQGTKAKGDQKEFRHAAPLPKVEYDVFGNPIRPRAFQNAPAMKTYGSSAATKPFLKPKEEPDFKPKAAHPVFRVPGGLPTPKSSGEQKGSSQQSAADSSQHSEGPMDGAAEHITSPEQSESESKKPQSSKKKTKKPSDPPSSAPTTSQEAARFRAPKTLTQAVRDLDSSIIAEEQRKYEEEEEKAAALAARLPDEGPCPMNCGKILPRSELDKLSMTATIKEQQQFCRRHQIADAERTWKERKYPELDWNDFPERLEGYESTITRLFEHPDKLHFRKKMAERIKSGKSRNLLQQMKNEGLDSLGVGYYGSRGHDMMTNHISKTFARELRERAVHDRVMSAQGAMAYVQEVLVPELATVLIKEDMNVPDGEARRIMSASSDIGDLLHPSASSAKSKKKKSRAKDVEEDTY